MRKLTLFVFLLSCFQYLVSQETSANLLRYIEVTGSAEMIVIPDEIVVGIGIQEYWMEDYSSNAKFKDYKTKVPIWVIENNLVTDLNKIGITKDDIEIDDISSYGKYWGKEFLCAKEITVSLNNMEKVNLLFQSIDTKGIEFIRIDELKNKQISEFRKQVKLDAYQAAKTKAKSLVESIDKQLGDVIFVAELDPERNNFINMQDPFNNAVMSTPDTEIEDVKIIKLQYEVKARFEIKK